MRCRQQASHKLYCKKASKMLNWFHFALVATDDTHSSFENLQEIGSKHRFDGWFPPVQADSLYNAFCIVAYAWPFTTCLSFGTPCLNRPISNQAKLSAASNLRSDSAVTNERGWEKEKRARHLEENLLDTWQSLGPALVSNTEDSVKLSHSSVSGRCGQNTVNRSEVSF